MRWFLTVFVAGLSLVSNAKAAEPLIFHTAHFDDDTVVSLGVLSNHTAERAGYDFDVLISLSQDNAAGAGYSDPGKHRAFVKCGDPAKVSVRGIDYPVHTSGAGGDDWKDDLWRAVCTPPVS
ncbi:hypothetical protein GFL84_08085 [Rhizobium leguminosarum bv. viciae]|nr:hypothetical protein [Rhizobium leguminosarum bv. viciae]NKM05030.1 hypothetical protein [Rhizobium leguminosarum bv. viciae]NKM77293.1 hypothetical protein [Rhizobium leguminosarum bv. viciae]